jgi:hypothetical protein
VKYNSEVSFISSQILAARGIDTTAVVAEDGKPKVHGFVRAEAAEEPEKEEPTHVANPDAIEIDDEDEDESEEDNIVSTKVPDSVFGSLANATLEEEPLGAKDRFKRRKRE